VHAHTQVSSLTDNSITQNGLRFLTFEKELIVSTLDVVVPVVVKISGKMHKVHKHVPDRLGNIERHLNHRY